MFTFPREIPVAKEDVQFAASWTPPSLPNAPLEAGNEGQRRLDDHRAAVAAVRGLIGERRDAVRAEDGFLVER